MLVHYHRGFVLKGYADVTHKKWFKKTVVREPVYCSTGIYGICDESEVEAEVAKKIKERMSYNNTKVGDTSWGDFENFTGWTEICTDEAELRPHFPYSDDEFFKRMCAESATITPVNSWPMKKIIDNLTGVQFAQFCKENDISGIVL